MLIEFLRFHHSNERCLNSLGESPWAERCSQTLSRITRLTAIPRFPVERHKRNLIGYLFWFRLWPDAFYRPLGIESSRVSSDERRPGRAQWGCRFRISRHFSLHSRRESQTIDREESPRKYFRTVQDWGTFDSPLRPGTLYPMTLRLTSIQSLVV